MNIYFMKFINILHMFCSDLYFILPSNNECEVLTIIIIVNIFNNTRTLVLNMFEI